MDGHVGLTPWSSAHLAPVSSPGGERVRSSCYTLCMPVQDTDMAGRRVPGPGDLSAPSGPAQSFLVEG